MPPTLTDRETDVPSPHPKRCPVDLKDKVGVSCRCHPVIACELSFKLTRSPPCVTESDQHFLRARLVSDVAKYLPARRDGEFFHSNGVGAIVVRAVYDEAGFRLHRAACEDSHGAFC